MSARRDALFALALWKVRGTFPTQALGQGPDRAFALELLGATLRHKASLEWFLRRCLKRLPDGELWSALMLGAAQLFYLPAIPDHAAVNETVNVAKTLGRGAGSLTNAILRRLQRERDILRHHLAQQPEWLQRDVPKVLWERWEKTYGLEQTRLLAAALEATPRTCLRPLTGEAPAGCEPHPDDPAGTFLLPHTTRLEAIPGFKEGKFVVQDAATRHAIDLLDVAPGQRVLDACAAPGGKTVQIAARLQGKGTLVANEPSADRALRLRDTLTRCHALPFAQMTAIRLGEEATPWAPASFDRILLDAPCSNTGVLGRRPDARWGWSPRKFDALRETQAKLLNAAADLLAPGGRLVYSTCSIEPEEDEGQMKAFLASHPNFTRVDSILDLPTPTHDGAFAAALVRNK